MSRRLLEPLLCVSVLLGLGIGLLAFGWSYLRTDFQLDKKSATVEGRVIDGSTRQLSSKGGQSSILVVEYLPANHAAIIREFDVDSTTYKSCLETGKATVTYFPEEPQISRVTRFDSLPYQILMVLGGIMIVAGMICVRHFMKRGKISSQFL